MNLASFSSVITLGSRQERSDPSTARQAEAARSGSKAALPAEEADAAKNPAAAHSVSTAAEDIKDRTGAKRQFFCRCCSFR